MAPNPSLRLELSSGPVQVAIVTDDQLVRANLARTLMVRSDITVVHDRSRAGIVLVDVADPDEPDFDTSLDRIADLRDRGVPALALVKSPHSAQRAISAGAIGAVSRRASGPNLLAAVIAALHGLSVLDPQFSQPAADAPRADSPLTPRETQVLALVADGLSNRRIGEALGISAHTAKFHITSLFNKLGVHSRMELVVAAARRGLLTIA